MSKVDDGQRCAVNPPPRHRPISTSRAPDYRAPDYEVGYKRPPKASQYKPGQSGNPKGRPRGAKGINTLARETLTAKVRVRTPDGEKRMSKMEAVLQKTVELAMKGNARAIILLLNLYRPAVPDAPMAEQGTGSGDDLSQTDIEILEMFREDIRLQLGRGS